ncbi:hypothetical protein SLS53_003166 [Cytospora paraplurivora]|uniref:Uncharacterized protein n=1 Tax=Cytospora paraplurivora TaxID=2898453 RepID=A0AAN9YHE3_9PEZI
MKNSSSDISDEDRHAHKYSKHARHLDEKHRPTKVTSHAHDGSSKPHNKMSHRYDEGLDSELDDEVLIKQRASRRLPRREKDEFISRQLRNIEKAQREVSRPGSSSSQEIHIHYHANPFSSYHGSQSLSSAASTSDVHATHRSKAQGVSANELTAELKDLTMSWISKREASLSHKHSSRRSKHGHEKHAKHGKKKDIFLAPLEQRWVCYECGKVRSDKIQERHPLTSGQKMQPNWCGQCRISHELIGRPLDHFGQRHYCWGCGIVRSEKYHRENPIAEGEASEPNYCRPCRELSPSFERNLREASDVGSDISIRNKAFQRQMHDAELSDIHEGEDGDSTSSNTAPGKENRDPYMAKKVKKATSFLLKNRDFKTKTSSDTSSEGSLPTKMLKAMHLEEEKKLGYGAQAEFGGARLSIGSYKPPSVESTSSGSSVAHVGTQRGSGEDVENMAPAQGGVDSEVRDAGTRAKGHSGEQGDRSPTILAYPHHGSTGSPKKVHWNDDGSRPTTAESNNSAFSCSLRSETSVTSAGSFRRPRRNPADTSNGSPLERDGVKNELYIGDSLRCKSKASERLQSSGGSSGQGLPPSQDAFGEGREFDRVLTDSHNRGQTLSGYDMPPTPPQERYGLYDHSSTAYQNKPSYWESLHSQPPAQDVPNFSRPYQSPSKPRSSAPYYVYDGAGDGTRPDYLSHMHNGFNSAAHFSDKDARRDFSGNSYQDPTTEAACEYTSYQDSHNAQEPFEYAYPPHGNTSTRTEREAYMYASQYGSHGGYHEDHAFGANNFPGSVPAPSRSFDFSSFGNKQGDKNDTDDFYSHVPDEEDIRNFSRRFMSHTEDGNTPPTRPQWHLYDDGDDDEHHPDHEFEWRGDGQTTIHRPSSGDSASSGNKMTILSIREITSDEDLETPVNVAADFEDAMKSICAA